MNKEALFSDGTSEYTDPCEPAEFDTVRLRLRTAKGEDVRVSVMTSEDGKELACVKEESTKDDMFDYYDADLTLGKDLVSYYFKIRCDEGILFYDRFGVTDTMRPQYFFRISPGFHTPTWAKGAVMYQILVDRFCNGDAASDVADNE